MLNWRQEIIAICAATMEVCWLRPLLVYLHQGRADDALPPVAILFLLLLAYWLSRLLVASRWSLRWVRVLILSTAILSLVGTLWFWRYDAYFPLDPAWLGRLLGNLSQALHSLHQPDLVALLAGVYLWWRGIVMARTGQTFARTFDGFRVGLVLLLLAGLAQSLSGLELQVVPYAFEFFFFGLAAIALSRLDEIDQRGQVRLRRDRYWVVILVGVIGLVLGLGLASAALFGLNLGGAVMAILGPVGWVLQVLAYLVLLILGYFAQLIVGLIRVVFPPLPEGVTVDSTIGQIQPQPTPVVVEPYGLPPAIQFTGQLIGGLALALLLLYILARAIRRWQESTPAGTQETHESLLSAATLGQDLSGWLRQLWHNWTAPRRRHGAGLPLPDEDDPLYPSLAIRRIYAELLKLAAGAGLTRAADQTPHEYLSRLCLALPQHGTALHDLTTAYSRARYDARRTTRAELLIARAAWAQVRDALRLLPAPEEAPADAGYTQDMDEMTMLLVKGRPGA